MWGFYIANLIPKVLDFERGRIHETSFSEKQKQERKKYWIYMYDLTLSHQFPRKGLLQEV